jgi:hypothetical protein
MYALKQHHSIAASVFTGYFSSGGAKLPFLSCFFAKNGAFFGKMLAVFSCRVYNNGNVPIIGGHCHGAHR